MAKGDYTGEFRAKVLAHLEANRGNVARTARAFGISTRVVARWRDKYNDDPENDSRRGREARELLPQERAELSERLEQFVHEALDSTEKKIAAANLQQLFVAIGISLDKMQLLKGRPTSISRSETVKQEINKVAAQEAVKVLQQKGLLKA